MTIDPGTDQPWGAGQDDDEPNEGEVQAGADPSALGHRDDSGDADKLQWGADEERYGHDEPADALPSFDPEPAGDPARLDRLDPGDDGGSYSAPGLDEESDTPTDL